MSKHENAAYFPDVGLDFKTGPDGLQNIGRIVLSVRVWAIKVSAMGYDNHAITFLANKQIASGRVSAVTETFFIPIRKALLA